MNIKFEKVILHNFLSFGDGEIFLSERGYCTVKGVNNYHKDSALSNGSGKSSIWSAISYALTGETIQGLKSNIVNINGKDGCFVTLLFTVDSTKYEVTRYKDYSSIGTDLKISIDGKDVSGKGVRESQQLLEQYLPDLTTELLGSVIILGQGLPHKFSNHSPSGRKEVLEKLSKSDFMIQDIKDRIERRSSALASTKRSIEDNILNYTSQLSVYNQQLIKVNESLEKSRVAIDFDGLINKKNQELEKITIRHTNYQGRLDSFNKRLNYLNEVLITESNSKSDFISQKTKERYDYLGPLKEKQSQLTSLIQSLGNEISKLKEVTDICPTCGQKIPGALKPDTSEKDRLYLDYHAQRDSITNQINAYNEQIDKEVNDQTKQKEEEIKRIKDEIVKVKSEINTIQYGPIDNIQSLVESKLRLSSELYSLQSDKKNYLENQINLQEKLAEISFHVDSLKKSLEESTKSKDDIIKHIEVINKMNTLVKRDFRGFLLSNVIDFIDSKSKEYSKEVFGTSELDFKLDGNNINISYCGKSFENLSGGEKQRVDLIIQFAVRDMMSQYLSFTSNILVLDEIFDGLDIMGTTNVLNLISKKLNDVESIFIISHNESLEIPYDDILTVTKDENGVSRVR
jgi:DNA repair exonuclease SbcCD ATPase subunit